MLSHHPRFGAQHISKEEQRIFDTKIRTGASFYWKNFLTPTAQDKFQSFDHFTNLVHQRADHHNIHASMTQQQLYDKHDRMRFIPNPQSHDQHADAAIRHALTEVPSDPWPGRSGMSRGAAGYSRFTRPHRLHYP